MPRGEAGTQSLRHKRALVEFYNFASLGEPERALAAYAEESARRGALLREHLDFVGGLSPFLEIGAGPGHMSYLLANEYGAEGFALDLSAGALRQGRLLREAWKLERTPVLVAGDATKLPFRDGALRFVMIFQTLCHFPDVESVVREIQRVLAPGGVLYFGEDPVRRRLTLGLYHAPYADAMGPVERRLHALGLLEFIARDAIGARQISSLGMPLSMKYGVGEWVSLFRKYFEKFRFVVHAHEEGWANRAIARAVRGLKLSSAETRLANALGGTISGFVKKAGELPAGLSTGGALACPECGAALAPPPGTCVCGHEIREEDGVLDLLPAALRAELYSGARADVLDFAKPGHEEGLIEGFHEVEGVYGNRYRWIGRRARVRLVRTAAGGQALHVRGYAPELLFEKGRPKVEVDVNGRHATARRLDRPGVFAIEGALQSADSYEVEIRVSKTFHEPGEGGRELSVNISMIRLVGLE